MRGWLAAPLTLRNGQNGGLIQLSDKYSGEFTEKDEAILVQLAQMAAVAIDNAQLYAEVEDKRIRLAELSTGLLKAQEAELKAVSRELHDNVSQILTAVKMNLDLLRSNTIWPPSFRARIEESIEMIKGALYETRDLAQSIRPPVLDELGLVPALRWHLDDFRRRSGIQVEFETTGLEPPPHPDTGATIYRVIQEAMTNVARHSEAQCAKVVLQFDENAITGSIHDDGKGFRPETLVRPGTHGGLGLLGMRERIELAGGKIRIDSRPGCGTRITFSVPNRRNSDAFEEDPHPSGR
jgi:signal transduction histidine kinase